ncbi:hypothetical protein AWJ20_4451 [Sugiyamaella lignohabitans]|uniref:Uncharacterized protein n=1 Tax=Sugiyamaella lignohabitans TaxID=796027 RepID=A0A167CFR3_9ASCO|nr:uncharacterized protein AWJ20_4451 [Sugiyamaella lignohabitans]ANB11630.1 hypothetical protein AWJ20_4451 [Sugiyamaella lignohabitans]
MSRSLSPSISPAPRRGSPLAPHKSANHERTPSPGKFAYSTGRGGAGNIKHGDEHPHPTEGKLGEGVPTIKQKVYTTGRGGMGNMRENKDEKTARLAQDVGDGAFNNDVFTVKSNSSIGRGGYGNVNAARNQESLLSKARKLFRN